MSFPKVTSRLEFANALQSNYSSDLILEIGPLNRPMITSPNVRYFDLLNTQGMRQKAEQEGLDPNTVPEIHFYHENGDLGVVDERFGLVVSAHVIEHQPDLIRHLRAVTSLLIPSGRYALVIPDKRYCFDAALPVSRLTDFLRAFSEQRVRPDIWSIVEHRALTVHNDAVRHWDESETSQVSGFENRYLAAIEEARLKAHQYVDVHCWQFHPESFADSVRLLAEIDMIDFEVEYIFETPRNDLEFFVILRKKDTKQE
jgi:SAM-dependent methyltransferase